MDVACKGVDGEFEIVVARDVLQADKRRELEVGVCIGWIR